MHLKLEAQTTVVRLIGIFRARIWKRKKIQISHFVIFFMQNVRFKFRESSHIFITIYLSWKKRIL